MFSLQSLFGDDAGVLREREFQILLLANVQAPLGTTLMSPVLDSLIGPFGTSAANVGLMISFFTAPGIVMIPVVGAISDRYGRKPVLTAALLLFGLAGIAIAFTTDFRVALALRLLQGVGFAGIVPVIITSIGDLYGGSREATGQGLRFMVSGLSGAAFPILSGLLVVIAWQFPFFLYATALPVAAAVALWFEEPTRPAGGTDADADADAPGATDGGDEVPYRRALLELIRRPRVLSLAVARTLPTVVWTGFVTFNSLIVVRLMGGTAPQAGLLVAVGSFVYAGAGSQAGRITSLFDSRLYPLVGGNGCLVAGMAVVLFAPGIGVATLGVVLIGAGFGVLMSLYRSIITGLASDELRGGLVSLAEAGGRVTATLTPVAMGGVIAVATPAIGSAPALQLAGVGATVVGAGGGLLCLFVANASPPAPAE